jgi:hypothetical protein
MNRKQATSRVQQIGTIDGTVAKRSQGVPRSGPGAASASRIQELESVVDVLETERANSIAEKQPSGSVLQMPGTRPHDARIRELESDTIVQLQDSRASAAQLTRAALEAAQQSGRDETSAAGGYHCSFVLTEDHTQAIEQAGSRALDVVQAKDTALEQVTTELQRQTMELSTR